MTFEKLCESRASYFTVIVQIDKSSCELIDSTPDVEGVEAVENLPDVIKLILRRHPLVLKVPKLLPPPRSFDHPITLVDESKLVNVTLYRYVHF